MVPNVCSHDMYNLILCMQELHHLSFHTYLSALFQCFNVYDYGLNFVYFTVMPFFDVKPHDQLVGVRRTVTMHCSVTGIPQPTIIWSKISNKPSGEKVI